VAPESVASASRPLTQFISQPNAFSFAVAFLAGIAGVLSLTSAKSGALIGVLISVTTIPAAGNIAAAAAYGNWTEATGALLQFGLNFIALVLAGVLTLWVQRRLFVERRARHHGGRARRRAGLPTGRTRPGRATPRPGTPRRAELGRGS
jgi:hypothetical protein